MLHQLGLRPGGLGLRLLKPVCLEPAGRRKGSHGSEKPMDHSKEQQLTAAGESPRAAVKARASKLSTMSELVRKTSVKVYETECTHVDSARTRGAAIHLPAVTVIGSGERWPGNAGIAAE